MRVAEQRPITAKSDQLTALVERLESRLAASRSTAANILKALVAKLSFTMPHSSAAGTTAL